MKLYHSSRSPFVRKVDVLAIELGLLERIERVPTDPWRSGDELLRANPLSKVPALVTDDGLILIDSDVICRHLDSLHDGPSFYPTDGWRWPTLRRAALAEGIMDAAVLRRNEGLRPDGERSPSYMERQRLAVARALDALEADAHGLGGPRRIDQIAAGCALGYLDLRFGQEDWREGRPGLAAWYGVFADRASMRATVPAA